MDFNQWVELLGRRADDAQLREALTSVGVKKAPKIKRDELSAAVDIEGTGLTLTFTDESILDPDGGVEGRAIMSSVMAMLEDYDGALPHKLRRDDSQATLRKRLGKASAWNEEYQAESWAIDGKDVAACYTEDLKSLMQVSVSLPNSE